MENFDISSLSYPDFLLYFFSNPTSSKWDANEAGEQYWLPQIKEPSKIVGYLTQMCTEFTELAQRVPLDALDAGLDGMLAPAYFRLQSAIWSDSVPLNARIACISSMYRVFSDFVAECRVEVLPGSFYMWWDHICTEFWFDKLKEEEAPSPDYTNLGDNDKRIVDSMFEVLCRILALDDDRAQSSALHGLGHLHHPGVSAVVQRFIDTLPEETQSPDALEWLQKCRDGTVM